jgi:hypothetical protein
LTEDAVRRIRADYTAGIPMQMLADEHGVNSGTIWFIVKGKNWKSLT